MKSLKDREPSNLAAIVSMQVFQAVSTMADVVPFPVENNQR